MLFLIRSFINGFMSRSGGSIFVSFVLSRVLSFIASLIALKLVDSEELGIILFAYSIIQLIIPIGGLGLHQSLLRYGALLTSDEDRKQLFSYALKNGIIGSIILIFLVLSIAVFIPFEFEETFSYLSLLSVAVLSNFVFELVKTQFRLLHKNLLFARAEFSHFLLLVFLTWVLTFCFGGLGYVIAVMTTPMLTAVLFIKKLQTTIYFKGNPMTPDLNFWKHGFLGGISNVITQLLFVIDIILIGELKGDALLVTHYKYISIIPFSVLFLPRIFITADYVMLTEKINEKAYIKNYIKSYRLFFSFMSVVVFFLSVLFSKSILSLFGGEYVKYSDSFLILIFGVIGIFIFRGIYGNLLSSIGETAVNYYIVSLAIVLNIISNYYLIPIYEVKGAAITTCLLMWLTGLLSWVSFKRLYNRRSNFSIT